MNTRITTFALACVVPATAGAQTLERWGRAGGWDVMIDPSPGHGCLIQAAFKDGSLAGIDFDRNQDAGYFTALNGAWDGIEEGAAYSVLFDLDGSQDKHGSTSGSPGG